jgi:hypothetical protein
MRRTIVGIGCAVLLYALAGVLQHAAVTTPMTTALRWILILMTHDLVLVPVVILIGVVVGLLPRSLAPAVRAGLIISGMLALVATWGVVGQIIEVQPGNNEILPNHYPTSLALLLGPVWLVLLAAAAVSARRARRRNERPCLTPPGPNLPEAPSQLKTGS